MKLSVPHGWSPEELENISHSSKEEFESKYKFLRSEEGRDIYWDHKNEKEVYIDRDS